MPIFKLHIEAKLHRCGNCGVGHNNLLTHRCAVPFGELGAAAIHRKKRTKQAKNKSR